MSTPSTPKPAITNTSTFKVLQGVGLLVLGIVIVAVATWVFMKNRDVFIMLVAGILTIGSFLIMGIAIEQRQHIEAMQYQIVFGVSMSMGILSAAVLAVYIARIVQQSNEKKKFTDVSSELHKNDPLDEFGLGRL